MKKVFIYYSLSGNGDEVASFFNDKGYDIVKVIPKRKFPKSYFLTIAIGGFLAGINHAEKLISFDANIDEYDEVIIGSPVWNGKLSTPINGAIKILDLNNKNICFVLYAGSGKAEKLENNLKEKYPNSKVIILKEPLKNYSEMKEKLKTI